MGTVIANIRIMPAEAGMDLAPIKAEIKKVIPAGVDLKRIDEKPIAYGLVALNVIVTMPDGLQGGTDAIEAAFSKISDVQSVETTDVGLV
ncbi:MAG: elongation factor 1-beta [Euryarchaeota archaeon]|nr:elongation factor 1-beta [Euryarchaeota archaeon]